MTNRENRIRYLLAAFTALTTYLVYLPALQNKFLDWDDGMYVYTNFFIRSFDSMFFRNAFLRFQAGNWHPLTWFSHAVDYSFWQLNPLGHHMTNNILHGLNTFLVALLSMKLLDSLKNIQTDKEKLKRVFSEKSVLVAAGITGLLFGLHPIHVESVAWISERKDVLCSFFYLLSLLAYLHYVNKACECNREVSLSDVFLNRRYILTLFLFMLSLMSKPMAVTLPVILLILDWYPLGRFRQGRKNYVLLEKLPFLLLGFGSSLITMFAQHSSGALKSTLTIPLSIRIFTGLKAPIAYLSKIIYPVDLSPFYPHPYIYQTVTLLSSTYLVPLFLLSGITAICIISLKWQKIWSAVWFCYLVTLLPVSGIIQVGSQAIADRYTYLPSIAPFFLIGLGGMLITDRWFATGRLVKGKKLLFLIIAVLLTASISYGTVKQIRIWENTETLWNRVIAVNPDSSMPYNNRGIYYQNTRQYEKALNDFTKGMSLPPQNIKLYTNRARVYARLGRFEDALNDVEEAIRQQPDNWEVYDIRAEIYSIFLLNEEALKDYNKVLSLNPWVPEAYNNRGNIYLRLGFPEKAIRDYEQAINLSPLSNASYYYNLAVVYRMLGQPENALKSFNKYKNIVNSQ